LSLTLQWPNDSCDTCAKFTIATMENRRTPTYDQIRSLSSQLQQANSVTKRRELGQALENLLSNYEVRKRLAAEATPPVPGRGRRRSGDLSPTAKKCHALSQLWTAVLTAAFGAVTRTFASPKTKITLDDIRLPHKLLQAASQPDGTFDDADGTTKVTGIPKLSRKIVRNALKYCLEMLESERVANVPGGEVFMLEMLVHLCSKPEYVGHFKWSTDFERVLSETTLRMAPKVEREESHAFDTAVKAFDGLLQTCHHLGIEMHMFVSDNLKIVSEWCTLHVKESSFNANSSARPHMFNATAVMLYSHPDHAIGPMKRYGRSILRFCRRAYTNATGIHLEAMNHYLLAHMYVFRTPERSFLPDCISAFSHLLSKRHRLLTHHQNPDHAASSPRWLATSRGGSTETWEI
jgi:hypothetical protein